MAEVDEYAVLLDNLGKITNSVRTPSFAKPRDSCEYIIGFGGWSTGTAVSDIVVYIPGFGVWINLETQLPSPWAYMGGAYYNGSIYLCGGYRPTGDWATKEVWKLDLKTMKMQEVNRMHESRNYICVSVCGGYLYAVGGNNQNSRLSSAERYDFSMNEWSPLPNMKKTRSDAALVTCSGNDYVLGGFDGHKPTNTCEVYDPTVNKWKKMPAMRTCRSGVKGLALGDTIYMIGGWDGFKRLNSCEVYNLKERKWTWMPAMTTPRSNHSIEIMDRHIYAIGGFFDDGITAAVEAFYLETKKWTQMSKHPTV